MSVLNRLVKVAASLLRDVTTPRSGSGSPTASQRPTPTPANGGGGAGGGHQVTEYTGRLPPLEYLPEPDDDADPGEVVWAWVPYEENDGRGKDRPVLVIARHRSGYLGLQATSKDHDRDQADEQRWGRHWFDIGSGAWDSKGRESEVRLDRVLALPAAAVRREGAGLDKATFDAVARALTALREQG